MCSAEKYIFSVLMGDYSDIISDLRNVPLLICDIDEVVLEFITPFMNFLEANGLELQPKSFALNGNIFDKKHKFYVEKQKVKDLTEEFYSTQSDWQTLRTDAREVLDHLSVDMDIVFLTAMPLRHRQKRAELLQSLQLHYPLIATEQPKGPVIKHIHQARHQARAQSLFFIDDMNYNHRSVYEHNPHAHQIATMANQTFQAMAPSYDYYVKHCQNWNDIYTYIQSKL